MQKKFDIPTAKKLLSTYAEKVNFYMKENQLLKIELEDAKTTLEINKQILYKNINLQSKDKEQNIFNNLKEENERLSKKCDSLYQDKIEMEKKLYKCQKELEESVNRTQEIEDNEQINCFKYQNIT